MHFELQKYVYENEQSAFDNLENQITVSKFGIQVTVKVLNVCL